MSGIELVAGVIAAFFAFGIVAGVLAVIALSALRRHRVRGRRRGFGEYDPNQTRPIDLSPRDVPRQPSAPDWEDGPGSDKDDDVLPPWPGRRG